MNDQFGRLPMGMARCRWPRPAGAPTDHGQGLADHGDQWWNLL